MNKRFGHDTNVCFAVDDGRAGTSYRVIYNESFGILQRIESPTDIVFSSISVDPFWNTGDEKELKMHKIHAYPAKFPAFLTTKAVQFASQSGIQPKSIADIFCGCGTVAFEANRMNLDFWGCDLNPVATLIARAKSKNYTTCRIRDYREQILDLFFQISTSSAMYNQANERLRYWFKEPQYLDLYRLKLSIEQVVSSRSKYHDLFLCMFSNLLKPCSVWLTKSIKPQVDPNKHPSDVITAFNKQCASVEVAVDQNSKQFTSKIKIATVDCLSKRTRPPKVDLIVTSPPYVTSYEYADLHQLSSLWLGFANDFRDLRQGSIGSGHHKYNFEREVKHLNSSGTEMVFKLYFLDMQQVATRCHEMLNDNGQAFFVIGNTEYKGVRIDNAKHLVESLYQSGFKSVLATKRKITGKILTPYRTKNGRFTTDTTGRKIYNEEFIIVGQK